MPEPDQVVPWKGKHPTKVDVKVVVYWPSQKHEIWKKFVEICKRDGHGASTEIREWVEAQVGKRAPGNPQRPLDPFQSPALLCKHKFGWVRQPAPHLDLEFRRCLKCGAKE